MERTRDCAELAHGSGPERNVFSGDPVTSGDNEKQYRETVYDAMVVALWGGSSSTRPSISPPSRCSADLGGPFCFGTQHPRPGRGVTRLKSDRGRLADNPPRAAQPAARHRRARPDAAAPHTQDADGTAVLLDAVIPPGGPDLGGGGLPHVPWPPVTPSLGGRHPPIPPWPTGAEPAPAGHLR